ncbi:restriction endonuclease subunit S [Bifidobacterium adolescentis]|uniref:restriction endonuclease subunit S n=1 Tax=Bifidobacterium adolescentis TaxID=1680 RepID=UPI0034A4B51C
MAEQHGKTLVPQIRFAGFTDPWEQRKLGDVAAVYDGVHQTPDYQDEGVMFLSVENIATLTSQKFISREAFAKDYPVYPKHGDVLMTRIGDIGTSNVVETDDKLAFYVSLALLKPFDVDSYYLDKSLQSPSAKEELYRRTLHIAFPKKINKNQIAEVMLPIPRSRQEQEQIGALFRDLDSLITLHQRKYDKLCVLKKSMLDKMFPKGGSLYPEIRFAGFTDPWEQRKLSDLTDRVSIQSSDSDLPQVEYEDIIPGEGTLNKDLRDKKGGKTGIKFYAGDVLYGKLRPYLMNWLYPQFNGVAVGDFWVLRATECDSSFLYRLVQTGSFQRLANVSSGSKMPRADWNLISQSFFAVPADHAEQKAIAKGLAELDTLITLHQRKLELLRNIKKSMLDKMFV